MEAPSCLTGATNHSAAISLYSFFFNYAFIWKVSAAVNISMKYEENNGNMVDNLDFGALSGALCDFHD